MVTAMVALQRAGPDATIRATERSLVEPSVIGLEPGDALPLEVALNGLLLNSGNDAALAIAEALGDGSIPRFVVWMNALAESLGLRDSHFANPHGLDEGLHYASAYDLAVIGRALLREPALGAIVRRQRYEFDGPPRWVFHNTNPLLPTYGGLDGLKTGFETRAGRCLAASATRGDRQVIVVILHSPQPDEDAAALLDYGFAQLAAALPTPRGPDRSARLPSGLLTGLDPLSSRPSQRDDLAGPRGGPWRPRDPTLPLEVESRSLHDLLRVGPSAAAGWQ
jgi:D-alanyl-D-alanine carboxypeptidase